ncbi:MAG: hypothetical protein LBT55_05410 [Clostridiaceae bacterium]|jgi:hypothetical protein|nr:hypothetical protein [Clostridiaceae bacterium]
MKKTVAKFIVLILAVVAIFTLTACNKEPENLGFPDQPPPYDVYEVRMVQLYVNGEKGNGFLFNPTEEGKLPYPSADAYVPWMVFLNEVYAEIGMNITYTEEYLEFSARPGYQIPYTATENNDVLFFDVEKGEWNFKFMYWAKWSFMWQKDFTGGYSFLASLTIESCEYIMENGDIFTVSISYAKPENSYYVTNK